MSLPMIPHCLRMMSKDVAIMWYRGAPLVSFTLCEYDCDHSGQQRDVGKATD